RKRADTMLRRRDPRVRRAVNNANPRRRSSHPDYMARYYGANRSRSVGYIAARTARKMAATVGRFRAREVSARDEYRWFWWGRTTDPKLSPRHPMRTVWEHKPPLSRGGAHSLDTCATACWECNARKGAKTEEEYKEAVRWATNQSAA